MQVNKLLKEENGSSLPFVVLILALFALGFIALIIDLGFLYVGRKEMITSADSAALAGAQVLRTNKLADLPKDDVTIISEAKTTAEKYATNNGANHVEVSIGDKQVSLPDGTKETRQVVEATVVKNEPAIFARFLGSESTDVKSYAMATWGYDTESAYFPIFVFDSAYKLDTNIILHDNVSVSGSKTNSYGFVDVNGTNSMDDIKKAIEGGEVTPKSKGDIVGGVPGKREALFKPVSEKINDIVLIPVINSANFVSNNSDERNSENWKLLISYFAYFKITDVVKQNGPGGNSVEIKGEFTGKICDTNIIVRSGDQNNPNPDPNGDTPATYSKLIK